MKRSKSPPLQVGAMVILYDRFNFPKDIYEIIFATKQQVIVSKALIEFVKDHGGEINKTEMSLFATQLHDGDFITVLDDPQYRGKKVRLSYNKRQFYDRIVTPFKSMGLIEYDLYKKTYRVSEKFYNDMLKIGLMWKEELRRPAHSLGKTKSRASSFPFDEED